MKMFSIIMPVWNRAGLVKNAIESVLAQTFQDYELLIIDDGSKDHLEDVVRPYLSEKISYHRIPHSGACAARNYGLTNSVHPFISYLDSDNRWHPEFLERMRDSLQGVHSSRDVAYCIADLYRKNPVTGKIFRDGTIGEPFSFRKLIKGNYIDINTFVHSRKAIEFAGQFDEKFKRLGDWDLIIRMTSLFEPVFVPEILVDYYFCVADNALSIIENLERADTAVRKKYARFREPITFVHDTIKYTWYSLSEEKYCNWVRVNHEQLNTLDYTAWGYPFMLQIEPTNACNLECPLCPVGRKELGRKTEHMSLDVYKSIIDDMERNLLLLVLWDWGEPFMHPRLPDMIEYASRRDIRTVTSTNAHFLNNDAYAEKVLSSGLSTLIVAIDSLNDESYSVYRRKGNLERAIAGLQNVIRIKKNLSSGTCIALRMVIMKQNEHEVASLRKLAKEIDADRFVIKTLNPSCGSTNMDDNLLPKNPRYRRFEYDRDTGQRIRIDMKCRRVWEMANILSNGDVVPCCFDYNSTMKLDNVKEKPFSEIWNSPAYRELRKKIYNEKDSIEKCRDCWISFKLSEKGLFLESYDLTEGALCRLKSRLKRHFEETPVWKILRTGKNSLRKLNRIVRNRVFPNLKARFCIKTPGLLSSQIRTLKLPLEEDKSSGWKAYDIFKGPTRHLKNFSCHVSVLSPEKTPHQPHEHVEEELLIMLSGEAELIIIDTKQGQTEKRHRVRPGSFAYYPAWQRHTIHNPGRQSATYLMFKWDSKQVESNDTLKTSVIQFLQKQHDSARPGVKGIDTTRVLEGATQYLRKLHSHLTTLQPGCGYPPHEDPYDVAILVLSGSLETLGQLIYPNSVVFYASGDAHGMKNVGTSPALYLVFEFHGGILD